MIEPLKAPERMDLFQYMVNKDKPNGDDDDWGWTAGEQLGALKYYTDEPLIILAEYMEDDYQGDCFAILHIEDWNIVIWRDSFGSCSGCDGLEDADGYEYIKNTLTEGNTLQFRTLEDARQYVIEEHKDKWSFWEDMLLELFDEAKEKLTSL